MNMQNTSDEELVRSWQHGKTECYEELMQRYSRIVKSRVRSYFLVGGEREDLISEGLIGLFKAVRDYENGKSSFKTFAILCINRQIFTAIKLANRSKHIPLNSYISLSANGSDEDGDFESFLSVDIISNPETMVIEKENTLALKKYLSDNLSKMEKTILKHYLKGKAYSEIAVLTNKNVKTIDNALMRIRKKLTKIL